MRRLTDERDWMPFGLGVVIGGIVLALFLLCSSVGAQGVR